KIAAQMTRDLRESEERFRLITENASDLIGLLDREGRRVYVNRAYERLFGDRSAMVGKDAFMHVHPEDRDRLRGDVLATVREGKESSSEFRFLLPNGEVRYIESHRSPVRDSSGNVAHVVVVSRDVTERRQNDEALRLREMQLEEAQAIANLGIWVRDVRSNQSTWSEHLYKIFGLSRDKVRPSREAFLSYVHPEDRDRVAESADATRDGGPTMFETRFRIVRTDGSVRPLESRVYVNRDESGRAVRVVGVCQDVTEKLRTEERAKASEERFRMMVENVRDYAIYMLDSKGHVISWNLGAERINGYKADEVIGEHYSRFFLPEQAARGDPGMQLEFASIQGRYESEGWRVRKDGSHLWAHIIVTPLLDEAGNRRGYSEITHDITERKRVEEDLYSYADRLRATSRRLVEVQEAERRLLAGELHDRVGQNLTALGLNLSIIAGGLPAEDYPELAARLEDSSALVAGTVDAMRNIMAELRPNALDDYGLAAALRSLAAGFSRRTGIQVTFDGDAPEGAMPKPVDLAMFRIAQEALNNVVKHAGASRVEIAFKRLNGRAALSVSDDGVGFDPKRAGSAPAGWGLLIMRERAEAVGAEFSLKANPDAGVEVLVEYRLGNV
ncbi:MAG: PAS domain S-box protein, partial [Burkholderiales bacterium]